MVVEVNFFTSVRGEAPTEDHLVGWSPNTPQTWWQTAIEHWWSNDW